MKSLVDRLRSFAFLAATLAAGIAIGFAWREPAPAPALGPEVFRANPPPLIGPPNSRHIVLLPLRGHQDEAIVRAYFATDPELPNLDELSTDEELAREWGPDSEGYDPGLPFHGQRWLRIFVGRYYLDEDRYLRVESDRPEIFILIDTPDSCGYNGCDAFAIGFQDGEWKGLMGLYGSHRNGFATISLAGVPIEGRILESMLPWRYGPPLVIQPMNDGRPTFIWGEGGVYWDGKDWTSFCWLKCDDWR
jgi:hypothetical protein